MALSFAGSPFKLHAMSLLRLFCLSTLLILAGCARRDVLIVGVDATYPPFEFVDDQGQISGVTAAIAKEIGKDMGKSVEFRNINFDGLIPALQSGQIDLIISSLTANEVRRKSIDFSDPYVKTGLSILAAKDSSVMSAADLQTADRKLAVRIATTGEQWCRKELPTAKLVALDTDAACVLEVLNGKVDAWVYDQVSVMNYHAKHPDRTRALLAPLREEFWAVGLKKGQDELKATVNATLARMKKDGQFAKLADQYLAKERDLMKAQGLPFVFE
jgi:polar amino acid transport system substrate-binding protein